MAGGGSSARSRHGGKVERRRERSGEGAAVESWGLASLDHGEARTGVVVAGRALEQWVRGEQSSPAMVKVGGGEIGRR